MHGLQHEFMTDLKRTLDGNSNKSTPHPRGAASLRPQGSTDQPGRKQFFSARGRLVRWKLRATGHWLPRDWSGSSTLTANCPPAPFFKPPAACSEEREGLSCDPPAPVEAWTGANRVRAEETEEISGRARCRSIGGSNPARPRSRHERNLSSLTHCLRC